MEDKVAMMKAKENEPTSAVGDSDNDPPVADVLANINCDKDKTHVWNLTDFWEYVDLLLSDLQTNIKETELTLNDRHKRFNA